MIQDTINEVISSLVSHKLTKALNLLKPVFEQHPRLKDNSELQQIDDTFRTMLHYMRQNAADPDRIALYKQLLRRTYRVAADLEISWRCRNVGFYVTQFQKAAHLNMSPDFIRTVLETFVSDVAMLSLSGDNQASQRQEIFQRHQEFMERLFAAITVSCQWSDGERAFWTDLITSPTIDASDALLITSAIMLSAMNQFDANKITCLADVYVSASDTALRQRALIGFVFSIDKGPFALFNSLFDKVNQLVALPGTAHELMELQKQIFYCVNAERDTRKIENEIMPDLTRNVPYHVNGTGMIEERDNDPMEEILHPDAEDKAMEQMEQSIQKIADMQRQGADVYFGGFSRMKRFPFFQTAANWFLPYSPDQPEVSRVRTQIGSGKFIDLLMSKSAFCESDKYSFTFALSTIFNRMPPNLKEMINSSEAMGIEVPEGDAQSPAFIRRQYLQDLYRFFKLHPQRTDLVNPFDAGGRSFFFVSDLFRQDELEKFRPSLAVFLHDQKRYDEMHQLLETFSEKQRTTFTYYILQAIFDAQNKRYAEAQQNYHQALSKDPDSEMALRGEAHTAMMSRQYEVAAADYARLLEIRPGKMSYLINRALALIDLDKIKDAAAVVYEADYRFPENVSVRRLKAWLLLCEQKPADALEIYRKIVVSSPNTQHSSPITQHPSPNTFPEDYLNMGYTHWVQNDLGSAADAIAQYCRMKPTDDLFRTLADDKALLANYGIDDDDITLMAELVDATL